MRFALAACALGLAGCATPAPSSRDVVATDPADAARFAGYVAELEPAIRALLPGTWDVDLAVVVDDAWGDEYPTHTGYTLLDPAVPRATIHLNRDGADARETLSHELVHALIGMEWRTLPPVVEEGLCTWVAEQFTPPGAPARAARLAHLGSYFGELALPLDHVDPDSGARVRSAVFVPFERSADPSSPGALLRICGRNAYIEFCRSAGLDRAVLFQEIGYLVARRILEDRGARGLHALCRRAADANLTCVPGAWLLEAARLETRADWLAAAWAGSDEAAFDVWLTELPELSAEPLAWACAELYDELAVPGGLDAFWELVDPRLSFAGDRARSLSELRGVRERVRR